MTASAPPTISNEARLGGACIARISTVPFYIVAQLKNQIAFLGQRGARVVVVASDEPELIAFDGLPGVETYAIEIFRSISPWHDLVALFRLWRFFQRQHIQIAHSTTPKAGLLTAIAAALARVPVRLHTFTGQPWVTMSGATRHLARACDKLIGVLNTRCYTDSPSQKQFLVDEKIVSARKLSVIGLGSLAGVDIERFRPTRYSIEERRALKSKLELPGDANVLLFVGRITADKGVHELLQAFRQVGLQSSATHLVFVGHFDEQSGVASSVTKEDVLAAPNVHVVDYSPEPEAYMAIADILCLPSYREGFGTVVIEAAAMGVPTVGTAIYGLTDAVVHGETGLLVPPRDARSLAEALFRLISDTALRTRMGLAARQRVVEHFDARRFNLEILAEYQTRLAEAGITGAHA